MNAMSPTIDSKPITRSHSLHRVDPLAGAHPGSIGGRILVRGPFNYSTDAINFR